MAAAYGFILLLMLCCCSNLVSATDFEDQKRANSWSHEFLINHTISAKALSYPGCGFRNRTSEQPRNVQGNSTVSNRKGEFERLIGGVESERHSWPWMVAIFPGEYNENTTTIDCGASLISRKYALTAAHCFPNTDPSKKSVVVGEHYIPEGIKYPVRRILIHPDYRKETEHNDIALIEFEIPVKLSKRVYPVCLPSTALTDMMEENIYEVVVTGWGRTAQEYWGSRVLQEIEVWTVPLEKCKAKKKNLIKEQICADATAVGKSPCQGDSGGPMVYKLEDNSYVQVGIVSTGAECGDYRGGSPSIYTRVSEYLKWIYDNSDLGE